MNTVTKRYRSAFLVDKSKLTRLMSVIKEKLDQDGLEYREEFAARLSSTKTVTTSALSDVFDLDNSRKSRIVGLVIKSQVYKPNAATPEHEIEVEFDGREPVDVNITIKSDDSKWARDASAIAEEQVERTLQTMVLTKILGGSADRISLIASISGVVMFLAVFISLFFSGIGELNTRISERTMWLTSDDISKLRERLNNLAKLSPEELTELQIRQLRNVVDAKTRAEQAKPSKLLTWKTFFLVLPFVLVGAALFYAVATCYPSAVFLWGDAEEWYATLVGRRRALWSLVIVAITVGIIANLFVLGVADTLKS